jgi:adenylate cyclase
MATRNAAIPEDKRIVFRIGINVGDIIIEEADIHCNGVNIAARLEALADPGGICLSQAVADQVRAKLDVAFEDMGEQTLKNIARLRAAVSMHASSSPPSPARPSTSTRPSIARAANDMTILYRCT